ncbi:hypothetical protein Hs30E_18930 [Lactococcus hodotermopsidis]|uniref:Uncharacterized protein n=1 Tax=Pseudolactococcus hodotermopsidis TaxID=2709157 RepID=A0A6A0BD62_9LACT|nr:hypothetical protein [Lactococcus hodotermopsidis]GFH43342.1 hypothetical protein Hs30E_18930 [Lactococcus hodotermopsidis]
MLKCDENAQAEDFTVLGWTEKKLWVELSKANFPDENFRTTLKELYP